MFFFLPRDKMCIDLDRGDKEGNWEGEGESGYSTWEWNIFPIKEKIKRKLIIKRSSWHGSYFTDWATEVLHFVLYWIVGASVLPVLCYLPPTVSIDAVPMCVWTKDTPWKNFQSQTKKFFIKIQLSLGCFDVTSLISHTAFKTFSLVCVFGILTITCKSWGSPPPSIWYFVGLLWIFLHLDFRNFLWRIFCITFAVLLLLLYP